MQLATTLAKAISRAPRSGIGVAFFGSLVLSMCVAGCGGEKPAVPEANTPKRPESGDLMAETRVLCGSCHAPPTPNTIPRNAWPAEIERCLGFYAESGRHDLKVPPKEFIESRFRMDASAGVPLTDPYPNGNPRRVPFEQTSLGPMAPTPAVTSLRFIPERGLMLATDMRSGELFWLNPREPGADVAILAKLTHPARVEPCDLNQDGAGDFVAAELGRMGPEDHREGAVIWIRSSADGYQVQTLDKELGRVADVQPADVNGDGRLDLIVAESGWRTSGGVLWLEQQPQDSGEPKFERHVIDDRHGTIQVAAADLDRDGDLDLVALVGREHEVLDAFFNDGKGGFRRERLFDAKDPCFGMSSFQLIDFDLDGDLDVVLSNGDTMDNQSLQPSHGIRWLENAGELPYTEHAVAKMPGVRRALAADLDGDGDLDIAAVAYVPTALSDRRPLTKFDSIAWYEQAGPDAFQRHSLEMGNFTHGALEVADFDGDGRPDLAVGNYVPAGAREAPKATLWRNLGHSGEAASP